MSKELCRRLPRTAHVEVDVLREFVSWMSLEKKLDINVRNAEAVARNFLEYGLNVVLSYPFRRREITIFLKKSSELSPCIASLWSRQC